MDSSVSVGEAVISKAVPDSVSTIISICCWCLDEGHFVVRVSKGFLLLLLLDILRRVLQKIGHKSGPVWTSNPGSGAKWTSAPPPPLANSFCGQNELRWAQNSTPSTEFWHPGLLTEAEGTSLGCKARDILPGEKNAGADFSSSHAVRNFICFSFSRPYDRQRAGVGRAA